MDFGTLDAETKPPNIGDVILINRKADDSDVKILCQVKDVVKNNNNFELILSGKNDYFNWSMYLKGESWVWRVWNLGTVKITSITNTLNEFPRR